MCAWTETVHAHSTSSEENYLSESASFFIHVLRALGLLTLLVTITFLPLQQVLGGNRRNPYLLNFLRWLLN